jgi:hypothetical protein
MRSNPVVETKGRPVKKTIALLAVVAGGVGLAAPAALADTDPLAAVRADVAKVEADATARHDLVIADAQKLQADAQAAVGGTKDAAKATIQADRQKLRADRAQATATVRADREQLRTDLAAVHAARAGGNGVLRDLLRPMRTQLRQQHHEILGAIHSARAAVRSLHRSFRHQH